MTSMMNVGLCESPCTSRWQLKPRSGSAKVKHPGYPHWFHPLDILKYSKWDPHIELSNYPPSPQQHSGCRHGPLNGLGQLPLLMPIAVVISALSWKYCPVCKFRKMSISTTGSGCNYGGFVWNSAPEQTTHWSNFASAISWKESCYGDYGLHIVIYIAWL